MFFSKVCPVFQTSYPSGNGFIGVFIHFGMSDIVCRTLQYKYFPPDMWQCVLRAGEGTFGCLWVFPGPLSPKEPPAVSQCSQGGCSMVVTMHIGVWSLFLDTSLWHFTPDVVLLGLNSWNLGCSQRCCILVAWDLQSVPHLTFMTQTSKKLKKLRLDVACCIPIYILKREHAIPF